MSVLNLMGNQPQERCRPSVILLQLGDTVISIFLANLPELRFGFDFVPKIMKLLLGILHVNFDQYQFVPIMSWKHLLVVACHRHSHCPIPYPCYRGGREIGRFHMWGNSTWRNIGGFYYQFFILTKKLLKMSYSG